MAATETNQFLVVGLGRFRIMVAVAGEVRHADVGDLESDFRDNDNYGVAPDVGVVRARNCEVVEPAAR